MVFYIGKRILGMVPTLIIVVVLVFFFMRLIPGDPARMLAGKQATLEDVNNMRATLGLDKSVPVQFREYILQILHGDLGMSLRTKRPVSYEISLRYGNTLILAVTSLVWSTIVGILIGIWSARHQNKWQDYVGMTVSVSGISLPTFWVGFILISIFAVKLRILPSTGAGSLKSLVLPSFTMGLGIAAVVGRFTRSSLLETLQEDYIRTARAKGSTEGRVLFRHALRNSMISVITIIGMEFGSMMGGAVITETVFAYPGIGALMVQAVTDRDYPMVQSLVLIFSLVFMLVNLLIDVLYSILNPSIRLE
ncbi:ABC transporter permease subunit [Lachnospiraceae bacterium ZAX-1]